VGLLLRDWLKGVFPAAQLPTLTGLGVGGALLALCYAVAHIWLVAATWTWRHRPSGSRRIPLVDTLLAAATVTVLSAGFALVYLVYRELCQYDLF
jgi:hypothetical protein